MRRPILLGELNSTADCPAQPKPRIAFFFNSQAHQVLHGITTAEAIAEQWHADVDILASTVINLKIAQAAVSPENRSSLGFHLVGSALGRLLAARRGVIVPPKLLTLLAARLALNRYDAIALPERTSILLRRLGVRRPKFIHIDHGAGDRAAGFDRRIARFDFALTAGAKQRRRMLVEGLIREDASAVVGYPKFEAADRLRDPTWTPFADLKPIILYNPHFSKELASWLPHGSEIVRRIIATGQYNLIIAPHIRMCDSKKGRASAEALFGQFKIFPSVHLDFGSQRSIDMTYTSLADIYLGDVSSQVYEFLREPRPCIFVNSHRKLWKGDPNYAHWELGPVIEFPWELKNALSLATQRQAYFARLQSRAFADTFDLASGSCSHRAAEAIARFLGLRSAERGTSCRSAPGDRI
jgi:hypothetical protein